MALFDMTNVKQDATVTATSLVRVQRTTFAAAGIQERSHIQAALRDHISLIGDDLYVVAEEFGDFEGVQRRIDLLCLDKTGRLVVVELKRTADGGHMELQALRYAAMVSTMTFAHVVRALAKYRKNRGLDDDNDEAARADLLAWLDFDDDEPVIARDVRVILASEDFSQEITTTVLWLNELHDFDIRCVRMSPYQLGDRLLLDVQQVIPLPEASAYTVRVREKENVARHATGESNADRTKFIVATPSGMTAPLPKRWAMLRLVEGLVGAGVDMAEIRSVLPPSKTLRVDGLYDDPDELWDAIQLQFGKPDDNRKRWHLGDPISTGGQTWVLHNNWGVGTREWFDELSAIGPNGFKVIEAEETNSPPK